MDGPAQPRSIEELTAENERLRARVEQAESALAELRADSRRRAAEVRQLVHDVPATLSRWSLLRSLGRDVASHPDKPGVAMAATRKLGRAPARAWRSLRQS